MNTALNSVDGEWRHGHSSEIFSIHNPATSEVITRTALADERDVDAAAHGILSLQRLEGQLLGVLHGKGRDGVDFYNGKKM